MTPKKKQPPPPERGSGKSVLVAGIGVVALVLVAAFVIWPRGGEYAAAVGDVQGPGRLEAITQTVDLGAVPFDRQVEARWEVVNTGGKEVRFVGRPNVKTVEGC